MPVAGVGRHFNPRSPCGERQQGSAYGDCKDGFQSTLPVWGATMGRETAPDHERFQSTLPVWGATQGTDPARQQRHYFNPRSPCGERQWRDVRLRWNADFNPRSPCGERRGTLFQIKSILSYFNPRSPCGERHLFQPPSDGKKPFQSTLPVWGATPFCQSVKWVCAISIHAPRVGSDACVCVMFWQQNISIHAPRVGSDERGAQEPRSGKYFNPRSPCGERLHGRNGGGDAGAISIHAPRVGSDC